ncbi:MAG: hypothetical protein FWC61_00460 [Proteobacteria bacterium]|nr:hypothetical protein [Pseudomonadota bacterium]
MFNKTVIILFGALALAGCVGAGDEYYNDAGYAQGPYVQSGDDCVYIVPPGGRQFVDANGVPQSAKEGDTIVYKNTLCADIYAQDNTIVPMQPITDTNPARAQQIVQPPMADMNPPPAPPVVSVPAPAGAVTIAPSAQPVVVKVVCEAPPAKPAAKKAAAAKPAPRKAKAVRNYNEPLPPPTITTREWINGVEVPNPSTDICD